MVKYSLALRNDKDKQYDRIALFINVLNFALFLYLGLYSAERNLRLPALISAAFIGLILLIPFFLVKIKYPRNNPGLFLASIFWVRIGNVWAGIVCFTLALLNLAAKRQVFVNFFPDKIVINSFWKKVFSWQELNQVIIKDGLLTIDFKNNKIIQSEISNSQPDVNEKEFNEFCSQQLRSAISAA